MKDDIYFFINLIYVLCFLNHNSQNPHQNAKRQAILLRKLRLREVEELSSATQ